MAAEPTQDSDSPGGSLGRRLLLIGLVVALMGMALYAALDFLSYGDPPQG